MSERLLPPRDASRRLGVHYVTLKRWIYSGKIRAVRTPSGRWMIPESEVERIVGGEAEAKKVRAIIYARVSSSDKKSDLEKQIEFLFKYCSAKGYKVVDVLSDIASGLKTDRIGLMKVFNYVINKQIDVVVMTYKDRITRFGFEYLEYFFKQYGVKIEAIYGEGQKDELVDDLIDIITLFAEKLYSMKSYKKKKLIDGFKKLIEEVEESG